MLQEIGNSAYIGSVHYRNSANWLFVGQELQRLLIVDTDEGSE